MKGSTSILLTLVLIAAFVLVSCAPTAAPTAAPEAAAPTKAPEATKAPAPKATEVPKAAPKTKITLWHGWKETEIVALNAVIAAFQQSNPDAEFEVLYVPFDDLRGKFETAAATGGGPTVLIGAADWGPALFDAELVADVGDMAGVLLTKSINEAALGAVQYKGKLIGLPQTIKGVVMFRNAAIIERAPATYTDLIAAARGATRGDVVGADLERGFFFSAAHLSGLGGALLDANGNPAFNNEAGVRWVSVLKSFADAGPTEYYTDNDVNLFKAGKAGIIIDGTWNMTALAEAIGKENLSIDPWPKIGDKALSGYVQTENIYLSNNADGAEKEAGWKFMEFFLSADAQAMLVKAGHIPAISGVVISDLNMQQAVKAFEGGAAFPVIPEMSGYWDAMDTALKSAFDEGTDPAAALATAEESINAKIKELRVN